MQEGITQFAEGLIKRDTRLLATAMRKMGFVARETGMEPFERLIEYFYAKFTNLKIENFKNLNLSDLQNMDDLIELKKLKVSFKDILGSFHVPRDWLLLERTMLLVVGLTSHLEPSLNPVEIVLPYVEKFVLKDKSFSDVIVTMTKEIGLSYIQLPHEIHKTLKQLNSGTLSISTPDLKQHTQRLYILGHQFLYAFLGLGGTFLGVYLEEVGKYAESMYAYVGAALFGAILLVSFLKNRRA
jgi:ubiquinone biosynthesis protein